MLPKRIRSYSKANESYWNKDNINIKNVNWLYDDGSDVTKWYNDAKNGTVDWVALTPATTVTAKNDDLFDTYSYVSDTTSTSFMNFYNLNRAAYANVNDNTTGASTKSEEEKERRLRLEERSFQKSPFLRSGQSFLQRTGKRRGAEGQLPEKLLCTGQLRSS